MSKLLKADDPRLNGVINWRIHSIQKTQKNGKTPDSYESQRSKIFNIVDCNGKINSHLIQFTEILWSSLVEKVLYLDKIYSYTISAIQAKSLSLRCRGKSCTSSLSVVFDTKVIKIENNRFEVGDPSILEDTRNFK